MKISYINIYSHMINKILVIVVILLAGKFYGQDDYIITQNHDTIYGKVRKSNSTAFVNFKKDGNTIRYKASFGAIRGFYISKSDKHYDNVEFPKGWESKIKSEYLWRMTTGNRIKLYYHVEGLGMEAVPFLYVLKEGVDLTTLPTGVGFARKFANKSTYDRLRPMISDSPEALRLLDKLVPKREAFVDLINRYNQSFENE